MDENVNVDEKIKVDKNVKIDDKIQIDENVKIDEPVNFYKTFPFCGKETGIRKFLREGKGNLRLVIPGFPGNSGNHIKSKIKFKIIFMP